MGLFICFSRSSKYKLPKHTAIEEKLVNYQKQILVLEEKLKEDPYVLEDLELIKRKTKICA